jgi:hypothetical protein
MKKWMLYLSFILLIVFECLRVYLIMPMPGSQTFNSIDLAYFLGANKNSIRILLYLIILLPFIKIIKGNSIWEKIGLGVLSLVYIAIFYVFTFMMEADKMFLQPTHTYFYKIAENKIPIDKLVIGVSENGIDKAYPIQLIGYHHQVRDSIGQTPIMVTYCTVCRTGRVYSPIVNGKLENFRLVGMDHFNAMFEDATTKSWWRQANGECIAGPLKGYKLKEINSEQLSLKAWFRKHPNAEVLQPDEKFAATLAKMDSYDKGKSKSNLTKRDTASWQFKSWVLGIDIGESAKTYDWNYLEKNKIIQDSLPSLPILILLENDSASFHAYNRTVNNMSLQFQKSNDSLMDTYSQSLWNEDGICIDGKLKGLSLTPIASYQEYLHSWEYFHPKSKRYPSSK